MLRKAIWYYLSDIKTNPNYARILMEAQRDPDFYSSEYDRYLKEFFGSCDGSHYFGQEEGFFRNGISARLIKNMALGASVFIGFDHVVFDHDFDPNEMSDVVFRLVVNAAGAGITSHIKKNERIKKGEREGYRKAQIIDAAVRIFSAKGFSGATISDIAGQANLGEATLYEYFNNKEALLFSIPANYMKDFPSRKILLSAGCTPSERALRKLIWQWVWQLYSNEDFSRLLAMELLRNKNYYSDPGYGYYNAFRKKILDAVEQGQREGVFTKDFPPPIYFLTIIGTFDQFLLGQFLLGKPPLGIAELNVAVDTLVRAINPIPAWKQTPGI